MAFKRFLHTWKLFDSDLNEKKHRTPDGVRRPPPRGLAYLGSAKDWRQGIGVCCTVLGVG